MTESNVNSNNVINDVQTLDNIIGNPHLRSVMNNYACLVLEGHNLHGQVVCLDSFRRRVEQDFNYAPINSLTLYQLRGHVAQLQRYIQYGIVMGRHITRLQAIDLEFAALRPVMQQHNLLNVDVNAFRNRQSFWLSQANPPSDNHSTNTSQNPQLPPPAPDGDQM